MKVIATSDLHGQLENLDFSEADLVIIAGDFSKMTGWGKWQLHEQKKWIENKFIPLTQQYKNAQFAIIAGNHDLIFDQAFVNHIHDLNWKINWPENVHYLFDNQIEINDLKIYGTPWIPIINYRWAFETEHDKLIQKFSKIPTDLDILITHAPPRISGSDVDFSIQTNDGPFGSSELTQEIFMKQPKYVFCGHIHSGDHNVCEFEKSKICNVSRLDENYSIAYEPVILEI